MERVLLVVDMQNDFITGSLGTAEARCIVERVRNKIDDAVKEGFKIVYTVDTHYDDYLDTPEGKKLPIRHCIEGSPGWRVHETVENCTCLHIEKNTFGNFDWGGVIDEGYRVDIIGLCTDICVVSNALIIKNMFPSCEVYVHKNCCAGTTPEAHEAALTVMKSCQINIV